MQAVATWAESVQTIQDSHGKRALGRSLPLPRGQSLDTLAVGRLLYSTTANDAPCCTQHTQCLGIPYLLAVLATGQEGHARVQGPY